MRMPKEPTAQSPESSAQRRGLAATTCVDLVAARNAAVSDVGGSERDAFVVLKAEVSALVPEFDLVKVKTLDGREFVITRQTAGVKLDDLRVGQALTCRITRELPRVVSAGAVIGLRGRVPRSRCPLPSEGADARIDPYR